MTSFPDHPKPESLELALTSDDALGCKGLSTRARPLPACGKIVKPGGDLCPKCQEIQNYRAGDNARRAERARRTRDAKAEEERFLATSPLAAFNPEFDGELHGKGGKHRPKRSARSAHSEVPQMAAG